MNLITGSLYDAVALMIFMCCDTGGEISGQTAVLYSAR